MLRKNRWRRLVTWGSKALILGVLLVTVFSPFGQIFKTPVTQAETEQDRINKGYTECYDKSNGILVCRAIWGLSAQYLPEYSAELSEQKRLESGGSSCDSLSSCVAGIVYVFTAGLGSVMAYLGAWVLSIAIKLSLSSSAYALTFLSTGWGIVRDLANMLFILILVYIAFTVMFRAETAETMKRLAWVIVIALIINFSFFFVRVVIDAGNLLAVQFYNAIEGEPLVKTIEKVGGTSGTLAAASVYAGSGEATKDLTQKIMDGIGVQNILNDKSFRKFREDNNVWILGSWQELIALSVVYIAVGAILFMLAAMFLTVGIKFIVRVVVLWLVLIASPLALIARTVEQGRKYYDQWQDALIKHAFYPAFFLFIFYILTLFMGELAQEGDTITTQIFAGIGEDDYGNWFTYIIKIIASISVRLGFVIALIYVGLKASEAMGVAGANFAKMATGKVFGAGFGALGFASRNSVGWGGRSFETSVLGKRLATKGGPLGRLLWRGAGGLGRSSFDVRGTPGVKKGLALATGADVGVAGGKGGFSAAFDARVKRREEEAERLKPTQRQLQDAEKGVIDSLSPSDQASLKGVAEAFIKIRKDQKEGIATPAEVKTRKDAYNAELQRLGLPDKLKKAREAVGSENKNKFAESIETRGWHNLGGALSPGFPGPWISGSDKEAAVKIRETSNENERFMYLLRNVQGTTPTTGTGGAGTQTPPAGGGPAPAANQPGGRNRTQTPPNAPATPTPQQPPPTSQPQMGASITQNDQRQVQLGSSTSMRTYEDDVRESGHRGPIYNSDSKQTDGEIQKGLERLTDEQRRTREAIEKGAREQVTTAREGVKVTGDKLAEIIRRIKTSEIRADARTDAQREDARREAEARREATAKNTEPPKNPPPKESPPGPPQPPQTPPQQPQA